MSLLKRVFHQKTSAFKPNLRLVPLLPKQAALQNGPFIYALLNHFSNHSRMLCKQTVQANLDRTEGLEFIEPSNRGG